MNPSDMSDEQLRIAVAKALEWTDIRPIDQALCGVEDIGKGIEGRTKLSRDRFADYFCPVPDYPHDLNACHEFEEALGDGQKADYVRALFDILGLVERMNAWGWFDLAHATARQRCIALLAVFEN